MTQDLFEFTWKVTDGGYRWITTRAEDQPYPPDGLRDNATEIEKSRHRYQEQESEPRPYLSEVIPFGDEEMWARVTSPLKHFRGRLYRVFAQTSPTPDAILLFANNFGLLGGDIPAPIAVKDLGDGKSLMGLGEDQRKWIKEITVIADVVSLWDWVRERNTERLSEQVYWYRDLVRVGGPRGLLIAGKQRNRDLFETIERGDVIQPALLAVQWIVNKHLWERTGARLLLNRERELEQHIVPNGLIGAIWLDFALAIDGNTQYRKCERCGTAFPVFPKGHRRKFCSDKCRSAQHRHRHSRGERS